MPGRTRTTKKLAQRIDRDYFKRLYTIPRWRRILTFGLTGLALLWLAWHGLAKNPDVYTSGPIRSAHASFGNNCAACHATKAAFGRKVTNEACLSCHDGPIHQAAQTFTPQCTECHVEHTGEPQLSRTNDAGCTQCHANLKTRNGDLKVAAHIRSFDNGHPEFALIRSGQRDPGTIKFNHQVHLKKDLKTPGGFVQLKCIDCHRPGPSREYMAPVNYADHCSNQACHPLIFDPKIAQPAPHKAPEIVRAAVQNSLTGYIASHPADLRVINVPRIPERPVPPLPRNQAEWVSQRMAEAEYLLWNKTCKECHSLSYPNGGTLPEVAKAAITTRWIRNASFDHQSHQMLKCVSCHEKASTSRETSDVLLPGIKVCQECHVPGKQIAEARCFECHQYHDWSKEKVVEGKYAVRELVH